MNNQQPKVVMKHGFLLYPAVICVALALALKAGAADPTDFFLGSGAGVSITTGVHDTGVGYTALNKVTSGNDNTAFGTAAMTFTTGSGNTAIGSLALERSKGTQPDEIIPLRAC
ncbi:MAG: hypothetical protein DME32_00815 [Verrucomicrobia bacterium]|nr:MAG: hypothetical protein DME32_00815 [Verrucomicrobiota bacterium]